MVPDRGVIIIYHYAELILEKVVYDNFGALLWNKVLSADINPNVSDFILSRNLKTAICNNLL